MDDVTEPANLSGYAEEVAREIRAHAAVLEVSDDPSEIMTAVNSLRAAARTYVQHVFAATGWGNVFAALENDDSSDTPDAKPPVEEISEDFPVVTYWHEYRLRVHDLDRARLLLESRSRQLNAAYCEDYDDSYTGVIAGLAELDGWKPFIYDQSVVEVVSAKWQCELEGEQLG